MKIAILGATGFTGKAVLQKALDDGHEVFALVRDPARVGLEHDQLHVLQGDALNEADIRRVITGTDALIHCLGVGGKGNGKHTTLVSDSVRIVVDVMPQEGVNKLVCMSNVGAGGSGGWFANKLIIPLFLRWLKPLIEDKDRMEEILSKSKVDWVSARFPNIVEGPAKPTRISHNGKGISFTITTESAAEFMLAQATQTTPELRTPSVSN